MLDHLREAWESDWLPVPLHSALAAAALLGVLFAAVLLSERGFVPLLDHVNLAFHEAGHPIFGLFGETPGLYGGTLAQLLVPLLVGGSFWLRREAIGTAMAAWWFFENLINIATYVADARAQLLPLVGGGEHDWWHILVRWGVPGWDTRLGSAFTAIGWAGMLGSAAWLAYRASPARPVPAGLPAGSRPFVSRGSDHPGVSARRDGPRPPTRTGGPRRPR